MLRMKKNTATPTRAGHIKDRGTLRMVGIKVPFRVAEALS